LRLTRSRLDARNPYGKELRSGLVPSRFDNRTVNTFKKDIKFSTKLEKYFFHQWLNVLEQSSSIYVSDWSDNGCGNDGEFIAKGNTAGADYKISGSVRGVGLDAKLTEEPLEIKWVPTAGKFTLKENDLKAYVEEEASILFIYNSVRCGTDMRKPKDYDFERHIRLIESKADQIKWGIMWSPRVKEFYNNAKEKSLFKPINYMGGKSGVVLKQKDFSEWFVEENWN
tara:strand:- start:122836 stop:123513 length:678 start_codon:yes stop_codon:yes gene_type:complete